MPLFMQHTAYFVDRKSIRSELLVGLVLLALGLVGVVETHFLGINLTAAHGLFLSLAGSMAIWGAVSKNSTRAFYISLSLGFLFAILAIVGPYLGGASNYLAFSRMDHVVHFAFATVFLYLCLTWKRF